MFRAEGPEGLMRLCITETPSLQPDGSLPHNFGRGLADWPSPDLTGPEPWHEADASFSDGML